MLESNPLKPKQGGPAPLFDRLSDDDPFVQSEAVSIRVLDRDALIDAIQRDLKRLCNTRSPVPLSRIRDQEPSVITFGIPDHSHLSPRNGDHCKVMAELMEYVINAFEPRLREVRMTPVREDPNRMERFLFRLDGLLVLNQVTEAVSFPLEL
jgi:type VI secretion system protein ImpF